MVTPKDFRAWGLLAVDAQSTIALPRTGRFTPPAGALARGMGRSYGDVCLNPGGTLVLTQGLDRFLAFDPQTGVLECEAGVLLGDIQRSMIAQGWALAITPGTQFVTLGGAIANDVHGKNHHAKGSFCDHVCEVTLQRSDGEIILCGPNQLPDWFAATAGGLGLTGIIRKVKLRLVRVPSPWLDCETIPFHGLDAFFEHAEAAGTGWENTVSWIDGLAGSATRGLFMRANPMPEPFGKLPNFKKRARRVPLVPPISLINSASLRVFNAGYFRLGQWTAARRPVHYQHFFYPLDAIQHWNRIYGPKGFYQYQCVVPMADRKAVMSALLDTIRAFGEGSFLVVLKTFGNRPAPGLLSFVREGVTLAMDFPNRGASTEKLLTRLDAIVAESGGRLYAAKDARMSRQMFEAGYPALSEFRKYMDKGLSSAMSRRLIED